jgi:hypothetical protein
MRSRRIPITRAALNVLGDFLSAITEIQNRRKFKTFRKPNIEGF